jgi:glucosamine--fructose-6-phosphate aminotransferase (isomerizing)
MHEEAAQAPSRVAALLAADGDLYRDLARALRLAPPPFAVTIARGSSDHAASYAATLLGIELGLVTASLAPSLITRYGAALRLDGALALAISQSGASPDLVQTLEAAGAAGAVTAAIVNADHTPLADAAAWVLDQHAGPEGSVAATKSFIASLTVVARLAAVWCDDRKLLDALERLPERLEAALRCDWSRALDLLAPVPSLYVVGRGLTLGVAGESALKLKETSALHAEAVSATEIRHGPRAVVHGDFPVFVYALADAAAADAAGLGRELAAAGATLLVASPHAAPGVHLALPPSLHPALDPIVAIQAFYPFAAALAQARGRDPDRPEGLSKVTRTI